MKYTVYKLLFFLLILFLSNSFLLKSGLWMHQDASYYYKSYEEIELTLKNQLSVFNNYDSYKGFSNGILTYTKILTTTYSYILFIILGSAFSQAIFILTGYVASFLSFYFFLGIFFKDSNKKYFLSLIYAFNPLAFSLQGFSVILAGVPLFIYSFFRFFNEEKPYKFLLVNIFSLFIICIYIRFIQIALIISLFYIAYFTLSKKISFSGKKIFVLFLFYFLTFSPFIFSLIYQKIENLNTAFFYGELFNKFELKVDLINSFNLFKSFDLLLYDHPLYTIAGIIFFAGLIALIIKNSVEKSAIFSANLFLFIFSITLFGSSVIFGNKIYSYILILFPFLSNAPIWALYVGVIPIIILLGLSIKKNRHLIVIFLLYTLISISPFLDPDNFLLQKFDMSKLPEPYKKIVFENRTPPLATLYFPDICWRAEYMNTYNVPTQCVNWGVNLRQAVYTNPRFISGDEYLISTSLSSQDNFDNVRITHNLKKIIVANDIVKKHGPGGPNTSESDIKRLMALKKILFDNTNLNYVNNSNYYEYTYKDSEDYDFFIYSPRKTIDFNKDNFFSKTDDISQVPVYTAESLSIEQSLQLNVKSPNIGSSEFYFSAEVNNGRFAVVLNQAFSKNWKLSVIDKKDYESVRCMESEYFKITSNNRCTFKKSIIDFSGLRFLFLTKPPTEHLIANINSNLWYVDPENIEEKGSSKEIYFVIYNEKQIYFNMFVIISLLTIASLFAIVLMRELRKN